ncbi:MAG: LamB/YcsF family protein [Janthinobacterium lividum]
MQIDINADLGEAFGVYKMADDASLLDVISSANIACGFHAGDPLIMTRTVEQALARGVDIGAHPGFQDLAHFGRRRLPIEPKRLEAEILYQMGALDGIARTHGARVGHMSFHGALGNILYKDRGLAERLIGAIAAFDRDIIMPVAPNTEIERAAEKHGLRTLRKFFADRAYDRAGMLVSREIAGAVIHNNAVAAARVVQLLDSGTVTTLDGESIKISAQIVVVHSDTPGAIDLAQAIRSAVEAGGGHIVPMSRLQA